MVTLSRRVTLIDQDRSPYPKVYFGLKSIISRKKKWVTKMLGYDYEIIYKMVKCNVVEDALSRKHEEEGSLFSLSSLVLEWLEKA